MNKRPLPRAPRRQALCGRFSRAAARSRFSVTEEPRVRESIDQAVSGRSGDVFSRLWLDAQPAGPFQARDLRGVTLPERRILEPVAQFHLQLPIRHLLLGQPPLAPGALHLGGEGRHPFAQRFRQPAEEMDLRKYIVGRSFPKKIEGTNTKELGNGYQLKASIKYNYNLADNDTVEEKLNKISSLGNMGPFIADRLVSWKPSFLLTEYRQLCEDEAKGDKFAKSVLNIVNEMLTITEAAPSLEIKEPKGKKK